MAKGGHRKQWRKCELHQRKRVRSLLLRSSRHVAFAQLVERSPDSAGNQRGIRSRRCGELIADPDFDHARRRSGARNVLFLLAGRRRSKRSPRQLGREEYRLRLWHQYQHQSVEFLQAARGNRHSSQLRRLRQPEHLNLGLRHQCHRSGGHGQPSERSPPRIKAGGRRHERRSG